MMTTNFPFTNSNNYSFNSALIQISGGQQNLLDLRPTNASFYARYNLSINGNWGGGVLTGTAVGGASVASGKLNLKGNIVKYVNYSAINNSDTQQQGTIRFLLTPNYTGNPSSTKTFFAIAKADSDLINAIQISHQNTGGLAIFIADQSGVTLITGAIGIWAPVAGLEYEFELNWDITNGATRLFINGTQFGATNGATGIRSSDIGLLRIGSNNTGVSTSDFEVRGLIIFSAVQHVANYTAPSALPSDTIYDISNPKKTFNAVFRTDTLRSFVETSTKLGSDEIKYILYKDSIAYYHNGSAWVISNETYAQANTATEIHANALTFTSVPVNVQIADFLHSNDGSTTPVNDNVEVGYDFAGSEPTLIEAIIWGWRYDLAGVVQSAHTIEVQVTRWLYGSKVVTDDDYIDANITSEGYFEVTLKYEDDIPTELKWRFDNEHIVVTNFRAGISRFKQLLRS